MVVAGVIGKLSEGAVFLLLFLFPRQVPRGTLPPRPEPGTSSELPGDAEVGWRAQEEQGWECWGHVLHGTAGRHRQGSGMSSGGERASQAATLENHVGSCINWPPW